MRTLRRPLRFETVEDRVVPTLAVGVNVDSFGLTGAVPDGNSGAVGPSHFVQTLAGEFEMFDKAGNFLVSEADTDFWTAAGITNASLFGAGLSQPRVVYDALTDHWFAAEVGLATSDNQVFVARSNTGDPTGHWSAVHYAGAAGLFTSFPTLGVDANGVYVGAADFNASIFGVTASGVTLTAIPKASLLAATPTLAGATTFTQPDSSVTMGWSPQVVTNFDPNPTHATVVATGYYGTEFDQIVVTNLTWSGGVPSLGTSQHIATNLRTSLPGSSRQPGSRILYGPDDDRYTGAIYQVGDLIYAAHGISVDSTGTAPLNHQAGTATHNAVHLIVLRSSDNSIVAEKTYFNNSFDYSFASVAANANGDIVMGLNRSGSSATNGQVGAYVVHGRLDLTTPGLLPTQRITFDQELEVFAGQTGTGGFNLGDNPEGWGPYSATVVDPTNPNVFWTTQEYAVSTDTWGTRVAAVGVAPRALNVSSTSGSGTYGVGTVIPITVAFDAAVAVTGTPTLHLNVGADAVYTGGSGTSTLTFTYTVAAGQTTSGGRLDYTSTTPFGLTGATITDAASGIAATLTLPAPGTAGSLSGTFNIVIDTAVQPAPAVTGVNSTAPDRTYGVGADIPIQVTFDRPVHVTGVPQLALNTGVSAGYVSGDGTATLTFNYHVGAGEQAADLDYTGTAALTGGTITDQANGSAANTVLPAPAAPGSLGGNRNIVIDTAIPAVIGVSAGVGDGTYGLGFVVPIQVTFTRPVVVGGLPQLALNTGATVTYSSGSGTNVLTFNYTVGAGEHTTDLDYLSAAALTGGTITDQANGSAANTTLPAPAGPGSLGGNRNIVIDAVARIADITSSSADRLYTAPEVIDITVRFDQAVTVAGSPQLALNSGGTAVYQGMTGTDTLNFRYTVATGNSAADLDVTALTGGTIQAGGADASRTLPVGAGSLAANKNIVVDALGPTVVDFQVLYGTRSYSLTFGPPRNDLPWQITGVRVVFSEPVYSGTARSLTGRTATRMTGLKTNTLTWRFIGVKQGTLNLGLANAGANALKDQAGSPIPSFAQSFNVLWGDVTDDGVVNALDEAAVRALQAGPFQPGPAGTNPFADLSGDGLVNLIDVGITRTRRGTHL